MSCKRKSEVMDLLCGQLLAERVDSVEKHLSTCIECAGFAQEQQRLDDLLTSAERYPMEPPERIWENIVFRIQNEPSSPGFFERLSGLFQVPQFAYGLAASLLMVATAFVTIRTQDPATIYGRYLAEIDSFTVEATENPFLQGSHEENPFYSDELQDADSNPFKIGGVEQ